MPHEMFQLLGADINAASLRSETFSVDELDNRHADHLNLGDAVKA